MTPQDEAAVVACIPSLRRYARGLAGDAAQADDLVQDTLERAWRRLAFWGGRGDLRAWMFGILHNRFIDLLRAQRRQVEDSAGDELPEVPQRDEQSDGFALRDLDRALQRLPGEQRAVLLLVAVEGLDYRQTAEVLDVPIGTVMSRLARGRERLRRELGDTRGMAAADAGHAPAENLRRVK